MHTIKVITYNIHSGKNLYYKPTLQKIQAFLQAQQADIIALQEVHQNTPNGKQMEALANALNMPYTFGGNHLIADGFFGNGLFSKFPILHSKNTLLPSEREQRGLLSAKLQVGNHKLSVMVTHLAHQRHDRQQQMRFIQQQLVHHAPRSNYTLLLGDFNTTTPLPFPPLYDTAAILGKENLPTFPLLRKRIDYIYTGPSLKVIRYHVPKIKLSDHYPVVAELEVT